jgi:hypothetical protein
MYLAFLDVDGTWQHHYDAQSRHPPAVHFEFCNLSSVKKYLAEARGAVSLTCSCCNYLPRFRRPLAGEAVRELNSLRSGKELIVRSELWPLFVFVLPLVNCFVPCGCVQVPTVSSLVQAVLSLFPDMPI